jgi:hypothetical protein
MNDPRARALDDPHLCLALGTVLRITRQRRPADSAECRDKCVAVGTLIRPCHQFKTAEGAVEVQCGLAVGTDIIFFADSVSTV